MGTGRRVVLALLALLVLFFGLACLNYTQAEGVEHHREWSRANSMPQPSQEIFYAGAAATALGGIALGIVVANRRR